MSVSLIHCDEIVCPHRMSLYLLTETFYDFTHCSSSTKLLVGDIVKNTAKVRHLTQQAQAQDCDMIAFPELCLTGYPPEDLLLRASLGQRIEAALKV